MKCIGAMPTQLTWAFVAAINLFAVLMNYGRGGVLWKLNAACLLLACIAAITTPRRGT